MPTYYTITFKGADNATFSTGVVTKTLYVLSVEPRPLQEGKEIKYLGGAIRGSRQFRTLIDVEFWPFSVQHVGTPVQTTEDLYSLRDLLEKNHLRIESCTLPRWSDTTNFPSTAGRLPLRVELTDISISLDKEAAVQEATYTFKTRSLD